MTPPMDRSPADVPMTEHTRMVHVRGHDILTRVRPGTRPVPLVLCNGIGASLEVLQPLVDALDPEIEVIRFDVPGTGGSPSAFAPYRFSGLARILGGVLDQLGHDRVDIFGLSWGGALAQQFAFQNPRRCRRVVLANTGTGSLMVPASPKVLAKMLTPRRHRDSSYAASIAQTLYGGSTREDPTTAGSLLGKETRAGSVRGYQYQLLAGLGWTSLPFLRLLRQDALLLFGDDDPIIPVVNGRIFHRLLPHSTLVVYDGGHLDVVLRAPQVVPHINRFLLDQPAAPATT
ncbi:MAG: poly(3-hydroxyalkanoate) depolymerase [Knoellia sp.]